MNGYVSVENRGRKVILFTSARYASGLKSRSNSQNNRCRNPSLHWCSQKWEKFKTLLNALKSKIQSST